MLACSRPPVCVNDLARFAMRVAMPSSELLGPSASSSRRAASRSCVKSASNLAASNLILPAIVSAELPVPNAPPEMPMTEPRLLPAEAR